MAVHAHTCGAGALAVTVEARSAGRDWLVHGSGGTAKLGAAALAVPCRAESGVRASASVLTVPGHRDDVGARSIALRLCKAWGATVCVTVGIHVNHASADDIAALVRNADAAAEAVSIKVKEGLHGSQGLSQKA